MAERGVDASYETIRGWLLKLGPAIAANQGRLRPALSEHRHRGEMVVRINGERGWLWHAVDHTAAPSLHDKDH